MEKTLSQPGTFTNSAQPVTDRDVLLSLAGVLAAWAYSAQ